jgi:hypothetical protein
MKANRIISKKEKLPDRPLKADELIDLLERSYKETVESMGKVVHGTLPVLLFLQKAIDQDESLDDLIVEMKDGPVKYCTADNGVARILGFLPAQLFEAWNEIDLASLKVGSAVERYRKIHLKIASA